MRQGSNPRRSRGRGPRKPHASTKQTFDSNGPDVRIRGSAYQVLEKYLAMARDATSAGDRIAAENYLQHAEHYFRILNSTGEHHGPNGRHRGNGRADPNGAERPDGADETESVRRGSAQGPGDGPADSEFEGGEAEDSTKGIA